MNRTDIEAFSNLLELAGYGEGALILVERGLVPLAKQRHISLYDAALEYADQDAEQDTSYFQLFHALQNIPEAQERAINIHEPL